VRSALRHRNYRLWASGSIVSNSGTWMQRVAQDWLVLTELTSNSGTAVGITTGLQFAPMLLLGPIAGSMADRYDRRRLLIGTQIASAALALALGLLVITGTAQLWMVYGLAFGLGLVAALDGPARQAFVSELVPVEDLPNAVGLNSASFNGGRLIGPALAGLLIHWAGTGPVFLINAASFAAVVFSLTRMRPDLLYARPLARRGPGGVREGLAYVRQRPDIALVLVIIGMVGTFGFNFQITTALMARLEFGKGASEYGLLGSVMAIGTLGGALFAVRRKHPRLELVVGAAMAFGVFSVAAALMPTYWTFAASLVLVGVSSLTLMTAANASVQLRTAPEFRGRVMALYLTVFMGGTPVGAPIIGWLGELFGPRWTILVGGLVSILTAASAWVWLRARGAGLPQAELGGEELVSDERDDVEQGVRDDQRPDPASSPVPLGEDQAHDGVAEEGADALVQVIRAAQHGAGDQDRGRAPAQLPQSGHQVADHDHLLDHRVLDRLEDQNRNGPPVRF
jgi:MFS family permease